MDKCDEWDFSHGPVSASLAISNEPLATMYRAGFKAGYDAAIEKLRKLETLKSKYPDYLEDTRPAR